MTRMLNLFLIPLLVGCATGIRMEPIAADHPANPNAFETPPASPSMMLREESQDRERTTSSAPSAPGHSHEGMQPRSGDEETADTTSGESSAGMAYTCSMHPEIIQAQSGKCPQCGMDLVLRTAYICSMHPKVIQMEPGICPECGMSLVKRKGKTK